MKVVWMYVSKTVTKTAFYNHWTVLGLDCATGFPLKLKAYHYINIVVQYMSMGGGKGGAMGLQPHLTLRMLHRILILP